MASAPVSVSVAPLPHPHTHTQLHLAAAAIRTTSGGRTPGSNTKKHTHTPTANTTHITTSSSPSSSSSSSPSSICTGFPFLLLIRFTFLLAFIACVLSAIFYFHELKHAFLDTLVYIRELGPLRGSIVLCLANIIGALLFMPCVPFTLGAGFLYGTLVGSIIVSIASTIAAVIAFLCARYLARVWIEKSLGSKGSKFRILDNAINQDGFRIVLLIRSSPLHPYGVCNYLFGLTSVTGRDYTVASFLGMLPATIMEVYLGSAGKNVADIINGKLDNSMLSRIFFCKEKTTNTTKQHHLSQTVIDPEHQCS